MSRSQSRSWKQIFGSFLFFFFYRAISSSNKCIYKVSHQIISLLFHYETQIFSHLKYTLLKFPAACLPTCWDSPEALTCNGWRNWIGFGYDNHRRAPAPGGTQHPFYVIPVISRYAFIQTQSLFSEGRMKLSLSAQADLRATFCYRIPLIITVFTRFTQLSPPLTDTATTTVVAYTTTTKRSGLRRRQTGSKNREHSAVGT